jgi:hypothetical protein
VMWLKMSPTVRGMMPRSGPCGSPSIVYVLPAAAGAGLSGAWLPVAITVTAARKPRLDAAPWHCARLPSLFKAHRISSAAVNRPQPTRARLPVGYDCRIVALQRAEHHLLCALLVHLLLRGVLVVHVVEREPAAARRKGSAEPAVPWLTAGPYLRACAWMDACGFPQPGGAEHCRGAFGISSVACSTPCPHL